MACEISSPARDRVHAASNGESKPLTAGEVRGVFSASNMNDCFSMRNTRVDQFYFSASVYNIELNTSGDVKFSLLIILTKKLNPRETKQLFSHLKGH